MKYSEQNKPLVCMQTQSTCYKGTTKMKPYGKPIGILWHSSGANNTSLARYLSPSDNAPDKDYWLKLLGKNKYGNDWNHVYRMAGLNCWVGKLADGTVTTVQTLEWNRRPWGCGGGKKGSCNDAWVQFEVLEDNLTDKNYFDAVYKEACEITAYICKMYDIDPLGTVKFNGVTVPTILCHWDSYKLGLGGGHSDIYPWFNKHGKDMTDVRRDVATILSGSKAPDYAPSDYMVKVVVEQGDTLNCRSEPVSGSVVATYKNGEQLHITKVKNGWGYTGKGWISLLYTVKIEKEVDFNMDELQLAGLVKNSVRDAIEEQFPRYERLENVPEWYQPTIKKLMNRGALKGIGEPGVIHVSDDFCRTMTILDRMGKLD